MDSVVHFEIPAKNLKRAKKFYETAFGWKINKYQNNYFMAYTAPVDKNWMPTKAGAINGALQKSSNKRVRLTVQVKDVKKAIKTVEKAGGKLVHPILKIEDMLLMAVMRDTEGNEVGLAQYLRK